MEWISISHFYQRISRNAAAGTIPSHYNIAFESHLLCIVGIGGKGCLEGQQD
jgi:hypothetical protein